MAKSDLNLQETIGFELSGDDGIIQDKDREKHLVQYPLMQQHNLPGITKQLTLAELGPGAGPCAISLVVHGSPVRVRYYQQSPYAAEGSMT